MILALITSAALIAVNGLFVAAEFAMISARKDRLQTLADQGRRAAADALARMGKLPALITGAQLGVTIASLVLGWIAEPLFAKAFVQVARLVHIPEVLAQPVALVLSLALVASAHVLFGEMVPKNLALSGPERAAMLLSGLLSAWVRLTAPVTWMFQKTASLIVRLIGVTPKEEFDGAVSMAELGAMISESRDVGLLDEEEHRRLTRLLSIGERVVAEVATPIERVVSLPARTGAGGALLGPTAEQVEEAVARTGFSRFPVRRATDRHGPASPADFLGYVHLKDALPLMTSDAGHADELGPQPRPLPHVSAALGIDDAFRAMMAEFAQLALVVDEHGQAVGLASLEDLVRGLMDGPKSAPVRSE